MAQPVINYLAVLAAAVASIVLGFLWYGPLFGKTWAQLMGFDKKKMAEAKKKGMPPQTWVVMVIGTLITSYVLAHFVDYLDAATVAGALQAGFWLWLGFIVPVQLGMVLWEGKPWKLYFINVAYYLVNLSVMATILVLWA
ncbi:DUF1761 domain-containing protein [Candidatus Woesearchaeota archaeon]|nr:DUF1761 domain-containing protein [Candidatus Woesearchaeota archaeon]